MCIQQTVTIDDHNSKILYKSIFFSLKSGKKYSLIQENMCIFHRLKILMRWNYFVS